MNSPLISIGWELLARKRWATALVAIALPLSYALNLLWPNLAKAVREGHEPGFFMPFEFIAFLLSMATLFWLFSYAEPDRTGKHSGFPARLFVLPMRTFQLVSIPAVFGLLSVVAYYWLWGVLIFPQWGVELFGTLFRTHLLTIAAMLLVMQAVVWSFHAFPWTRTMLTAGLLLALGFIGIPESEAHRVSTDTVSAVLIGVAVLAWFGAVAGVARDRCGNWEGWTGKVLDFLWDSLPRRTQPFTSAGQAQFWIEWQRKGWFLSVAGFALPVSASLALFLLPLSLGLEQPQAGFVLCAPIIIVLVMASTTGGGIARFDLWSAQRGLTSFAATRPISTGDILMGKLKIAAAILVVALMMIVVLAPVAFNVPRWILPEELPMRTWPEFKEQFALFTSLIANPFFWLAMVGLTWSSMVSGLSIGLLARPNRILMRSGVGMVIFLFMLSGTAWVVEHPGFQHIVFPPLMWFAICLGLVKLASTARAFYAMRTQALTTEQQLISMIMLWSLTLVGVCAGTWVLHSYEIVPVPLAAALAAYFLPGDELPNCALHIAEDRHR